MKRLLVLSGVFVLVAVGCREDTVARDNQYWLITVARNESYRSHLEASAYLETQARWHASRMCKEHMDTGHPVLYHSEHLDAQYGGEGWLKLGENVGYATVSSGNTLGASQAIFQGFKDSSDHWTNIIDPVWTDMGVGAVYCDGVASPTLYVVQAFRRR